MKAIKFQLTLVGTMILAFGSGSELRAQPSNVQAFVENAIGNGTFEPLPEKTIPVVSETPVGLSGNYWGLQHLLNGNLRPPMPINRFPELEIYEVGTNTWILNDLAVDYEGLNEWLAIEQELLQMLGLQEMDDVEPYGGGGLYGASYCYTSDDLWLEVISVTNAPTSQTAFLVIHPPAAEASNRFDLFFTTNLSLLASPALCGTNWEWQLRTEPGMTNLVVTNLTGEQGYFMLGRTNDPDGDGLSTAQEQLWSHSNPDISDTDGDGMPDGWEWYNFGNFSQTATNDYDLDGYVNGLEYTNNTDPNKIQFSMVVTNRYVRTASIPVRLKVAAGVPSSMAVLVNDTNFASALWQPYNSNVLASLGATNGDYLVSVSLRGRLTTSQQSWAARMVTLDTVPPALTITNPAASVVSRTMIQLRGYAGETLAGLSFGVSNAAGILANEPGFVIGQSFDTNTLKFSRDYFQCFDIVLINGANSITLHAEDLAGNGFTTNFTLTLDTSIETNAPTFTLTWPPGTAPIAGDSVTLEGKVTDPTATVLASAVNSGNTNAVSGLVNREGEVWLKNLPLGIGTNQVTVTVTGVGGSSSTSFEVIRGAGLTMDPLTSDQLNQPLVDVSGSVSDTNYNVLVNGVTAAVENDGRWTAYSVPVSPSDTAVLDVNVYDAATNQLAMQRFSEPQPAIIRLMSYSGQYSQTWQRAGYLASPPGGGNLFPAYAHATDNVRWTVQGGGSENGHNFDTGYVIPDFHDRADEQWNDGLEADEFSPNPSTPSYFGVGQWKNTAWSGSLLYGSGSDHTESHVMLEQCRQAAPGETKYFIVQAQAEEYFFLQSGETLPPESVKLNLMPLMPSQPGDGSGVTVVGAPVGAPVSTTLITPLGNERYAVQVNGEPKLGVTVNGIALDPNVVVTNANFIVGQMLTFSTNWIVMPPGVRSREVKWTFEGTFVNDSDQPCADCSVNYITNSPSKLSNETTTAWWITGGTNGATIYTALLTNRLTLSNGTFVVATGKGLFSMLRPLPEFQAVIRDEVRVGTYHFVNGEFTGKTFLYFGVNTPNTNNADVGIAFVYTNAPSASPSTNTYGQYFITQVIDYTRQRYNLIVTNVCKGYETNETQGLDSGNPYQGRASEKKNDEWTDAPDAELSSARWLSQSNSFSSYLMFQPKPYSNSLAVPMYNVQWGWFGSATNYPWGKRSGLPNCGAPVLTNAFPSWTHTIRGISSYPTNLFQTNCFDEN